MDIPLNVEVYCTDGLCGHSKEVVINRKTEEVTHLVVVQNSSPHIQRMVPVDKISETTSQMIRLGCTKKDFEIMRPFVKVDMFREEAPEAHYLPDPYMMEVSVPESRWFTVKHEDIPVGEVAVRQGAHIQATDGRVGKLDEFLVDPETEHVTNLVMREGHLWGKKEVTIPVSEIDHLEEDVIFLKLNKHQIGALKSIPPEKQ